MSDAQCQTYPHVADAELRRILEAGSFANEAEIEHAMRLTYEQFGRIAAVTSYGSHSAMHRDYVREAYDAIAYNRRDEAHFALRLFWLAPG
jgi:hypothetical protein